MAVYYFYLSTFNLSFKGVRNMKEDLRRKVKALKAFYNISYSTIANEINISRGSMYNWLHNDYEFSYVTENRLRDYIKSVMGE